MYCYIKANNPHAWCCHLANSKQCELCKGVGNSLSQLAIAELNEYGFITERTQADLRNDGIDPTQLEISWADEMECTE